MRHHHLSFKEKLRLFATVKSFNDRHELKMAAVAILDLVRIEVVSGCRII